MAQPAAKEWLKQNMAQSPPLVFGTNGAMGIECQLFHKKLAEEQKSKIKNNAK